VAGLELDSVSLALILVHVHMHVLYNIGADGGRKHSGQRDGFDNLGFILGREDGDKRAGHG
jgi:hypothetical protein